MEVYISIFAIISCLIIMTRIIPSKVINFVGIFILIVLAGLRTNTGVDIGSYHLIYDGVVSQHQVEFGFLWITKFFNLLGISFQVFIFLWAVVSLCCVYCFATRYFKCALIPILYYYGRFFFLRDMGQIRSSLAAVICLFSIKSVKENKLSNFLMIVLFASCIHSAALFFILVYPFFQLVRSKVYFKNIIISFLISVCLGSLVIPYVTTLIIRILPRYSPYLTNQMYLDGSGINPITIMQIIVLAFSAYLLKKYKFKKSENYENFETITIIYWFSTLILLIFSNYSTVAGRLSTLPATVEIVLIPSIVYSLVPNYFKTLSTIILSAIIFYVIFVNSGLYVNYIPYQSIFGGF